MSADLLCNTLEQLKLIKECLQGYSQSELSLMPQSGLMFIPKY